MILRINGKGQSRTEYKTTPHSYYHSFLASLTVQMTLISLFPQNSAKCPTHSRCSVSDVGNAEEGLPWWLSGKESACQCGRSGFNPCIGKSPWRRKWQPTPVFLPGKSHGKRSLVSYSPWGCKRIGHKLVNNNSTLCATYICATFFLSNLMFIDIELANMSWLL